LELSSSGLYTKNVALPRISIEFAARGPAQLKSRGIRLAEGAFVDAHAISDVVHAMLMYNAIFT